MKKGQLFQTQCNIEILAMNITVNEREKAFSKLILSKWKWSRRHAKDCLTNIAHTCFTWDVCCFRLVTNRPKICGALPYISATQGQRCELVWGHIVFAPTTRWRRRRRLPRGSRGFSTPSTRFGTRNSGPMSRGSPPASGCIIHRWVWRSHQRRFVFGPSLTALEPVYHMLWQCHVTRRIHRQQLNFSCLNELVRL